MSSWFQSSGLNAAFDSLSETVQNVSESVQDAIPTEHKEFLAKLTLNTDEMISERQNFRDEATRKDQAKDSLNKILPWETLDVEREVRSFSLSSLLLLLLLLLLLFKNELLWNGTRTFLILIPSDCLKILYNHSDFSGRM